MKKTFLLLILALSSLTLQAADSCETQLAAKDEIIKALNQTIQTLASSNGGSGTVVINPNTSTWTCEAVCIQNLIGKGWGNPGQLFQSTILVSETTPEKAFKAMIEQCKNDTKATYERNTHRFSSGEVSGYMTKEEMNSPDWESKMVKAFDTLASVRKFCRKS